MLVGNFTVWNDWTSCLFWVHLTLMPSNDVTDRRSPPKRPSPMPSRPKPGSWNTPKTWVCSFILQQRLVCFHLSHLKSRWRCFLPVSPERCCCKALCGPLHKRSKSYFAITGQTLHHLVQTAWSSPPPPLSSAQSEGLRHRHGKHVWVLGCEFSLTAASPHLHPRCAVGAWGCSYL